MAEKQPVTVAVLPSRKQQRAARAASTTVTAIHGEPVGIYPLCGKTSGVYFYVGNTGFGIDGPTVTKVKEALDKAHEASREFWANEPIVSAQIAQLRNRALSLETAARKAKDEYQAALAVPAVPATPILGAPESPEIA